MSKFSVGDEVFVRFRVKQVHEHDAPPSLTLETILANPGTDGWKSGVTLCEDLVEKGHVDYVSAYPHSMPKLVERKKRTRYDFVIPHRVFVAFIVLVCLASIPWFDLFRVVFK